MYAPQAVAKNIAIVLRNMCTRSSPDESAVEGVLYTWEAIVQHGADLPMEVTLTLTLTLTLALTLTLTLTLIQVSERALSWTFSRSSCSARSQIRHEPPASRAHHPVQRLDPSHRTHFERSWAFSLSTRVCGVPRITELRGRTLREDNERPSVPSGAQFRQFRPWVLIIRHISVPFRKPTQGPFRCVQERRQHPALSSVGVSVHPVITSSVITFGSRRTRTRDGEAVGSHTESFITPGLGLR